VIVTGAFGAIADPASAMQLSWAVLAHQLLSWITLLANIFVSALEWGAIDQNGKLVDAMIQDVRRIRTEHGLPN
jgi:hypothetical protein